MPQECEKGLEGTSLIRMEKKVEEVTVMIQLTQVSQNPKARRRDLIYCQLSLSKYFERSCLISILGEPKDFRERMISRAKITLSKKFHPSTYLDCSWEIIKGRMGLSLRAITLVRIL